MRDLVRDLWGWVGCDGVDEVDDFVDDTPYEKGMFGD